jgi:hypothetical protein
MFFQFTILYLRHNLMLYVLIVIITFLLGCHIFVCEICQHLLKIMIEMRFDNFFNIFICIIFVVYLTALHDF